MFVGKTKIFLRLTVNSAHLVSCSLSFTSFPFSAGGKYLHFLKLSWISSKKYSGACTRQVVLRIFQTLLVESILEISQEISFPY